MASISSKLPPLKIWNKDNLIDADWDFSLFCRELEQAEGELIQGETFVSRAFCWELDRELGSGNGPFPLKSEFSVRKSIPYKELTSLEIIVTNNAGKQKVIPLVSNVPAWMDKPLEPSQPLKEWHLHELAGYIGTDTNSVWRDAHDICAFEIPCSGNIDSITESFRSWLIERLGAGQPGRPGRSHEWQTWFRHFAIYRLHSAGYTRPQVLEKLGNNGQALRLSPPNFARSKRYIKDKIQWRFDTICHRAKEDHARDPRRFSSNWQDRFLKPSV